MYLVTIRFHVTEKKKASMLVKLFLDPDMDRSENDLNDFVEKHMYEYGEERIISVETSIDGIHNWCWNALTEGCILSFTIASI